MMIMFIISIRFIHSIFHHLHFFIARYTTTTTQRHINSPSVDVDKTMYLQVCTREFSIHICFLPSCWCKQSDIRSFFNIMILVMKIHLCSNLIFPFLLYIKTTDWIQYDEEINKILLVHHLLSYWDFWLSITNIHQMFVFNVNTE